MKYRADIDGLRALAILPVVLYHADIGLFSGGFVGVDVFFVISGYLITLIISEEIRQGNFTILDFYERRIRRIFPALFAVMLFCLVVATFFMHPEYYKEFGRSIISTTLFLANVFFWKEADYFAAAAESKPLLHTWSLSVEEQFYLLFPVILLVISKYFHDGLKYFLVPIAVISLVFSIYGVYYFPSATFYLIPTRAWELLLGSFLALGVFPQTQSQWIRDIISVVGLIMIFCSIFLFSDLTPFPGAYALLPCVGAALIIYAGTNGETMSGKLLSYRPVVFVGLISYSLYLWHWPIIVFANQMLLEKHNILFTSGIILLSFLLAIFSWKFIEQPFRKKGTLRQRKKLFASAIAIMLVSVILGYVIRSSDGWPNRFDDDLVSFKYDLAKYNLETCFLRDNQHYSEWKGESCFLQTQKENNTLLWGDSFAAHYVPGIKGNLDLINSNVLQYTASGCAPTFKYDPKKRKECKGFSAQIEHIITDYKIRAVIISADWALSLDNGMSYVDLSDTVNLLRDRGMRVVVIGQSPRFDNGVQDIANQYHIYGRDDSDAEISISLNTINTKLLEIAGSENFVDPSKIFCNNQKCQFKNDENFYFWDSGHFTSYGSKQVSAYIFTTIKI